MPLIADLLEMQSPGDVAVDDLIAIVDVSEGNERKRTKKLKYSTLRDALALGFDQDYQPLDDGLTALAGGSAFIQFSGPTTAVKVFALPNQNATILTDATLVAAAQGGTGIGAYAVGDLLYATATNALGKLADVAVGSVLISGGVGVAPSWSSSLTLNGTFTLTPPGRVGGGAPYLSITPPADTGISANTPSTGIDFAAGTRSWASSGTVTLQREMFIQGKTYTCAAPSQTFTDVTTVMITPPIAGTNAIFTRGHSLIVVDSTSSTNTITGGVVIATTLGTAATSVGIGGGNISAGGNIRAGQSGTGSVTMSSNGIGFNTSGFTASGGIDYTISSSRVSIAISGSGNGTRLAYNPVATSGPTGPYFQIQTPADTNGVLGTENIGIRTVTATRTWIAGTVATQREILIAAPTYAGNSATAAFTVAATFAISGAPIAGANASIGTGHAFWIQAGNTQLDGGCVIGAATGGNKGNGTLNVATDIYKNNTAYTNPDYVLEHWATGRIEVFAKKPGAAEYTGLKKLAEVEAFARENLHLPRFGQNAGHGLFSGADATLASLEEAYLYIFEQEKRIAALEQAHAAR